MNGVERVREVRNDLQVVPSADRPRVDTEDKAIMHMVEQRLKEDPQPKAARINVRIEGADMARMSDLVRGYGGVNVAAAAKILRNRFLGQVASMVTISGRTDQVDFSMWEVVGGALQNAFFKAILPGSDPERKSKPERVPVE